MAESPKRGAFKKFKFFKFKGFGSLSNIPRAFTLRRVTASSSPTESLRAGTLHANSLLEDTLESTQDDLNTMPKSPSPYARSCDMYSHMGTMPRTTPRGAGKQTKSSQSSHDRGTTGGRAPGTSPPPIPESVAPADPAPTADAFSGTLPSTNSPSLGESITTEPRVRSDASGNNPPPGQAPGGVGERHTASPPQEPFRAPSAGCTKAEQLQEPVPWEGQEAAKEELPPASWEIQQGR
ncbi:unnamed protein product [Caretta caretta]